MKSGFDSTIFVLEYTSGKHEMLDCDAFFIHGQKVFLIKDNKLNRILEGGKKITMHRGRTQ